MGKIVKESLENILKPKSNKDIILDLKNKILNDPDITYVSDWIDYFTQKDSDFNRILIQLSKDLKTNPNELFFIKEDNKIFNILLELLLQLYEKYAKGKIVDGKRVSSYVKEVKHEHIYYMIYPDFKFIQGYLKKQSFLIFNLEYLLKLYGKNSR